MFDVAPTELMLVALIALVVIGPNDLPRLLRVVGQWVGHVRGMVQHFRTGMNDIVRQAEIDEMQRKWADENARVMREYPPTPAEEGTQAPRPAPSDHAPEAELPLGGVADRGA